MRGLVCQRVDRNTLFRCFEPSVLPVVTQGAVNWSTLTVAAMPFVWGLGFVYTIKKIDNDRHWRNTRGSTIGDKHRDYRLVIFVKRREWRISGWRKAAPSINGSPHRRQKTKEKHRLSSFEGRLVYSLTITGGVGKLSLSRGRRNGADHISVPTMKRIQLAEGMSGEVAALTTWRDGFSR